MFSGTLSLFLVCFWFRNCITDLLTPEVTIFNFCYSLPYTQAEKKTGHSERLLVTQSSCFLPSFLLHEPINFSSLRRKINTRVTVIFIPQQNKPMNSYGVIVTRMGVKNYFLLDIISHFLLFPSFSGSSSLLRSAPPVAVFAAKVTEN